MALVPLATLLLASAFSFSPPELNGEDDDRDEPLSGRNVGLKPNGGGGSGKDLLTEAQKKAQAALIGTAGSGSDDARALAELFEREERAKREAEERARAEQERAQAEEERARAEEMERAAQAKAQQEAEQREREREREQGAAATAPPPSGARCSLNSGSDKDAPWITVLLVVGWRRRHRGSQSAEASHGVGATG